MAGDPLDRATRGVDEARPRRRASLERLRRDRLLRLGRGEPQVFEVGQSLGALGELDVFAAARGGSLDLGHRLTQLLGLAGAAVALGDQHVEFALLGLPAPEHLLVVAEQHRELGPGVAIERLALRRRGAQPDLIGLPVHDDQVLADLAQHADRGRAPADDGAAAARRR